MSNKSIKLNASARNALKRGIDVVGDAVGATIGPRGRNAAIGRAYGPPKQTNDGVTIAKEIELIDPFENMGASIMKDVAERTNDEAGDGTSTAIVLMQALTSEGMKHLAAGVNVMALRRGMERAGEDAIRELKLMAKPVTDDEIVKVATIASESADLGVVIANTIKKVGKSGVVTVEEAHTFGITSEIVEGLEIPRGYISPAMITDLDKMKAEYRDVAVLVTDKKLVYLPDIMPFLNTLTAGGMKSLVIIGDVDGEVLKTLLFNKLRGGFSVLAVRPPSYGEERQAILEDIAVTVGAKLVSDDTGITLEASALGKAHRVVADKDKTTIVGGAGNKEEIDARVVMLQKQAEEIDVKFSKSKLLERIGKLTGGVAIIHVGAATEGDMTYLKDKIEDAVNATKAAIEEGVVAGGGSALVRVARHLDWAQRGNNATEAIGYRIVCKALYAPLRQICVNAGKREFALRWRWHHPKSEIDQIIDWIENGTQTGYNAVTDQLVPDMLEEGIVDPVKVTRTAIERAVSASAILITTEVAIVETVKELLK